MSGHHIQLFNKFIDSGNNTAEYKISQHVYIGKSRSTTTDKSAMATYCRTYHLVAWLLKNRTHNLGKIICKFENRQILKFQKKLIAFISLSTGVKLGLSSFIQSDTA